MKDLSSAFYRHPAFAPHRLLGRAGIGRFWLRNLVVALIAILGLTLSAYIDTSFRIPNGYGYLEHPGTYGWHLIILVMPIVIYDRWLALARSRSHYSQIVEDPYRFSVRWELLRPAVQFVGFETAASRVLFAFLFLIGLSAFAWNTFQNLYPGELARLDFWDSIHFPIGYWVSRVYKLYVYALLLPSLAHIFTGIVWSNLRAIRLLMSKNQLRLSPFNPDRCGGFGFLGEMVLSPTIWALLIAGGASFGVVYTHGQFDVAVASGLLLQLLILVLFYGIPTFVIRNAIVTTKGASKRAIYRQQESYYDEILSGRLKGVPLRDAHEYLANFVDITSEIDKVSNWPHLTKASWIFGISISPGLLSLFLNVATTFKKVYPGSP